jgi:hypothetical protein
MPSTNLDQIRKCLVNEHLKLAFLLSESANGGQSAQNVPFLSPEAIMMKRDMSRHGRRVADDLARAGYPDKPDKSWLSIDWPRL